MKSTQAGPGRRTPHEATVIGRPSLHLRAEDREAVADILAELLIVDLEGGLEGMNARSRSNGAEICEIRLWMCSGQMRDFPMNHSCTTRAAH